MFKKIKKRWAESAEKKRVKGRIAFLEGHRRALRDEIIKRERKVRMSGIPLHERVVLRQSIIRKEKELENVREEMAKLISSSIK
jgi:RNase adaptor protein for sRNA GlmZ degradation